MNTTDKALWYLEAHSESAVTLDDVAAVAGVTRYHLSRAFGVATGHSIMQYLRGRRLTQAARCLADGAPDILSVALIAGYGSHEAFTRAFREQFGVTPEAVRAERRIDHLALMEPLKLDESLLTTLAAPRFTTGRLFLVAGFGERCTDASAASIPALWQRFGPWIGNMPGQVGHIAYGVCCNGDDAGTVNYVCGVEVTDFSRVPEQFTRVRIPEQRYAVFTHHEHVASIRRTWATIWNKWLPESGHQVLDAPTFERYDKNFDARSGLGGLEIWLPIKS